MFDEQSTLARHVLVARLSLRTLPVGTYEGLADVVYALLPRLVSTSVHSSWCGMVLASARFHTGQVPRAPPALAGMEILAYVPRYLCLVQYQ